MSRLPNWSLFVAFVSALALAGCSTSTDTTPSGTPSGTGRSADVQPADTQPADQGSGGEHEGQDEAAAETETEAPSEYAEALAQLSDEDRAAAEKQKTCPVSGKPLGAMGKPYKVTINDRDVFLCCEGCESKLREDPDKYLAKVSE